MAPRREPQAHVEVDRGAILHDPPAAWSLPPLDAEAAPRAAGLAAQLGDEILAATCTAAAVSLRAAASGAGVRVLLALPPEAPGLQLLVRCLGMAPGMKRLTVHRVDAARRWRHGEPWALEVREAPDPAGRLEQPLFLPGGAVALVCLDEVGVRASAGS